MASITTITVVIKNNTGSKLYAHVTGRDLEKNLLAVKENGQDVYRPTSPAKPLEGLEEKIAIAIDNGTQRPILVPQMEGGRIWFSKKKPLEFFRNPGPKGPAFVEPAANNVSDVNYNTEWGFCEFTYDKTQLFVNITYIDFICLPIALELVTESDTKKISGIPSDGLATICSKLKKQGGGWEKLVVSSSSGDILRAIGPNLGTSLIPGFMEGYFQPYIDQVWGKYTSEDLKVDTQGPNGFVNGRVQGSQLCFDGIASFEKPSSRDIFSCDTGPFAGGAGVSPEQLNIGARISAAINRSTLHSNPAQPQDEKIENYYKEAITNHYARICHEANSDGLGYAFPYDDVHPSAEGTNQEGSVNDTKPKWLKVIVGGGS